MEQINARKELKKSVQQQFIQANEKYAAMNKENVLLNAKTLQVR